MATDTTGPQGGGTGVAGLAGAGSEDDRRGAPRLCEDARVVVIVRGTPDDKAKVGETLCCKTEDVSATGLRLGVPHDVSVGTEVDITVAFSVPLCAFKKHGVVTRVLTSDNEKYPHCLGVQFEGETEADRVGWRMTLGMKMAQVNQ